MSLGDLERLADRAWAEVDPSSPVRKILAAKWVREQAGLSLVEAARLVQGAIERAKPVRLDLDPIRRRAHHFARNKEEGTGTVGAYGIAAAAWASAEDVPALLAEVERQRLIIKLVTELTHDTDGVDLDPDTDVPAGEVMRALAGEPL